MSGFSPDWLVLREPLDGLSRSADIGRIALDVLARARALGTASGTDIIDLGAGTGANLRYVAPLIEAEQSWLLIENDPVLLAAAAQRLTSLPPHYRCDVRMVNLDLASGLAHLPLRAGTLLTAAALLDLVSEAWLRQMVRQAAAAGAIVWFALTYDGRIDCHPPEPEDVEIRERVNLHQLRDKGFGPALGPGAAQLTGKLLAQQGYHVHEASSDWCLAPKDSALQYALLDGWCQAAIETAPHRAPRLQAWLRRRRAHTDANRSELRIGHVDLVAHP